MFCEKCSAVFESDICPFCGDENTRQPYPDDLCFLIEKNYVMAGMLGDILTQNNISFMIKNVLGAGMALKVGPMAERVRVYIPYKYYQSAKDIADTLFAGHAAQGEENEK